MRSRKLLKAPKSNIDPLEIKTDVLKDEPQSALGKSQNVAMSYKSSSSANVDLSKPY